MSNERDEGGRSARWQRRETRRKAERARIQKHGATLRRVYGDAVRKRLEEQRRKRQG
jgi:hypothetical protein